MTGGTRATLIGSATILFMLFNAQPAAAHGEEPRLEVTPEALNPGMVLQIRGVGFEFEEQVRLARAGDTGTVPLGAATADAEGVFVLLVTVPADLSEGTYHIHGSSDDHEVDSPQFSVRGAAVIQGGGEAPREEDDGLLAAMPTYAPGVSVTPLPAAQPEVEPEIEEKIIFMAIGALALAGLLIVLGSRAGRTGRDAPG